MKPLKSIIQLFLASLILFMASCGNNQNVAEQAASQITPVPDNLAPVPPMGWNSWNGLGKGVSEQSIKEIADVFITSGLKDAGYNYIVIDDYWHGGRDSATGNLFPDPVRFPSGMKVVADYVHSKGLKFGIYSDAGTQTCGEQPGSYGYEEKDAKLFAEWGVDFLKYDYCFCNDFASENNDYRMAIDRYKKMGDALRATGRPIVFSICEWGPRAPWLWGREVGGQLWRTSYDVHDFWDKPRNDISPIGILTSLDVAASLERFAGPGGWNDPDMLVIGLKNKGNVKGGGCTETEYRTQMSMWCMLAAPLLIGCDVRSMDETTKTILMNKDLISIDQDPLGKQGFRVYRNDGIEAFQKPLSGGRFAIALLNRNSVEKSVSLLQEQLELPKDAQYEAYDVWKHETSKQPKGEISSTLQSHECQVFILNAKN